MGCTRPTTMLDDGAARALVARADRAAERDDIAEAVRGYVQCVESCPGAEGPQVVDDLAPLLVARPDLAPLFWQAVDRIEERVVTADMEATDIDSTRMRADVARLVRIYAKHRNVERPRALSKRLLTLSSRSAYAALLTECATEFPASLKELSALDVELLAQSVEGAAEHDRVELERLSAAQRDRSQLAKHEKQWAVRRTVNAVKISSVLFAERSTPAAERVIRAAIAGTSCDDVLYWLGSEESAPSKAVACGVCPTSEACLSPEQKRKRRWVCHDGWNDRLD